MSFVQPETYVLTDAEAAAIQSAQMARQAGVARANPVLVAISVAVPVAIVAAIYAVDLVWYGGAMPQSLFTTLIVVFVAGIFTQTFAYKLTLEVSKRRMRQTIRQVFAPRTVRLTDEGIEQASPELRTLHFWSGIDRAERSGGLIQLWSGHLLALAIPVRAFASYTDAQAFLDACRQRARA
jgi:hypothetical protein